eukprot:SAG22_NODE_18329_length_289_cov_0.768421_1_plen_23_part_01
MPPKWAQTEWLAVWRVTDFLANE